MSEPEPAYRPAAVVRVLSIALVPLVALWEALKAVPRAIGWTLEELGRFVRTIARGFWWLLSAPFRYLVGPILRAIFRGVRWVAGRVFDALLPVLIRAGLLLRELLRAIAAAARALWIRLLVPLRLLGRAAIALIRRAALYLRLLGKAVWLVTREVWVRTVVPFRLLGRAIRWVAGKAWNWLLAPIGHAIRALFRGGWWLLRELGAGLRTAVFRLLVFLLPVLIPAWQAAQTIARALAAAARLAGRSVVQVARAARAALAWLVRPIVTLWRLAALAVAAAASTAGAAAQAARGAVRLAFHDAANQLRRALGRPALPMLIDQPHVPRGGPRPGNKRTNGQSVRTAFLGAVFLVLVFAVGAIVVAGMSAPRSSTATAETLSVTIAPPSDVTEQCTLLQPGGPLADTDSTCGTLAFGATVAALDCSKIRSLPASFSVTHFDDNKSRAISGPPLYFAGSSCSLIAPLQQEEAVVTTTNPPADTVIVADFVAPSEGEFTVGVVARCSSLECVDAVADGSGQTFMDEWLSNHWFTHRSQNRTLRAGDLNRIVMWQAGGVQEAWLNGQLMGRAYVKTRAGNGESRFFLDNVGGAGAAVEVDLRKLVILRVGS
jgi:hypothetical protein